MMLKVNRQAGRSPTKTTSVEVRLEPIKHYSFENTNFECAMPILFRICTNQTTESPYYRLFCSRHYFPLCHISASVVLLSFTFTANAPYLQNEKFRKGPQGEKGAKSKAKSERESIILEGGNLRFIHNF